VGGEAEEEEAAADGKRRGRALCYVRHVAPLGAPAAGTTVRLAAGELADLCDGGKRHLVSSRWPLSHERGHLVYPKWCLVKS